MIETERLPRRLAVIVYADVAEYSRLTGEDEDTTHLRLSEYLELIASNIESNRGKVMHYAGDAVLSRFDAVVDALSAAVAIQNILSQKNKGLPDERKVQFRIGINLGDVIEDRNDIYGDGVNVAARLESLAQPGGICISEAVYTAVGNKLALSYKDIGKQQVKNIAKPVQAYFVFPNDAGTTPEMHRAKGGQWLLLATLFVLIIVAAAGVWFLSNQEMESTDSQATVEVAQIEKREIIQPSAIPDASIAVLPFTNVSNDPDEDYYIDG
ncbi:MAG: adenylate/guanylate cyclase domain-containing protein, partial [Arenicellales bacterium]